MSKSQNNKNLNKLLSQLQDFTIDQSDDEEEWVDSQSQGQNALNQLLSRPKKSIDATPDTSRQIPPRAVIPTRNQSARAIPPSSRQTNSPDSHHEISTKTPTSARNESPKRNPFDIFTRAPARKKSDIAKEDSFTISNLPIHNPLSPVSSNPAPFSKDSSNFHVALEGALNDASVFQMLPLKIVEEQKMYLSRLLPQIKYLQSSSEVNSGAQNIIKNLFNFIQLERAVLQHIAAVLFTNASSQREKIDNAEVSNLHSQLNSLKDQLKIKNQYIQQLESADSDPDMDGTFKSSSRKNNTIEKDKYDALQRAYKRIQIENESISKKLNEQNELVERYQMELKDYKSEEQIQKNNSRNRKLSDATTLENIKIADEKHSKEVEFLKKKMVDRERKLRSEFEEELSAVTEQCDQEMKDLHASYAEKIKQVETKAEKDIENIKQDLRKKDLELRRNQTSGDEWKLEKKSLDLEHEYEIERMKAQSLKDLENARREIDEEYKLKISRLEKKLLESGLESAKSLERELEVNRLEFRKHQENASLKFNEDLDKLREQLTKEKNELRTILERTQNDASKSETKLTQERDTLKEKSEQLSKRNTDLESEIKLLNNELKTITSTTSKKQSQLESDIEKSKAKLQEISNLLEKEKEVTLNLQKELGDKESKFISLNRSLEEYKKLHENFEDVEERFKQELQKKDDMISTLEKDVIQERKKLIEFKEENQEELEAANDQVDRMKRKLNATEDDIKRNKNLIEEKEYEIMDLKKLIRSQNKQLENALGGKSAINVNATGSYEEAQDEIDVLKGEITIAKKKLETKEKDIFDLKLQLAEAQDKSEQLGESLQEIAKLKQELDVMQMAVFETKNSKVQLMERIDNAEHRENILKSELSLVRSEVDRLRK